MRALPCLVLLVAVVSALPAQRPKSGRWNDLKRHTPKGWVVYQTRNYQIQSQCGKDKAKRLGIHMEKMLKVYKSLFKPSKRSDKRYPIKLFRSKKEYKGYGGSPGSAAYFSPTTKEMVCYDTGRWQDEDDSQPVTTQSGKKQAGRKQAGKKPPKDLGRLRRKNVSMDLLGVAAHEGWHQYFWWYVGSWVQLPSWINEGMGDFFYAARPKKKGNAEIGRIFAKRLAIVKGAVESKRHVSIPDLIRMSKAQYYRNASVCYAQGWSLCTFLLTHPDKRYRRVIPRFVKRVENDTNMPKVTDHAFKGIDLEKLDAQWQEWVNRIGFDGKLAKKKTSQS